MDFGMLSHHWNGSLEQIQNWYCSRKYNGWSALWDGGITRGMLASEVPWYYKGKDKMMVSTGLWSLGRSTKSNEIKPKVIQAPNYFIKTLPKNIPTHGELWYNDRLDIVQQTCGMKYGYNPMWYNIAYMVFNIKPYCLWEGIEKVAKYKNSVFPPIVTTDNFTLKETKDYLSNFNNETFLPLFSWKIINEKNLKQSQEFATKLKWEGLMFANPESKYECKRSYNSLKWKDVYEAEAAVYGYRDGKTGKDIGKTGSIKATMIWDDKVISVHGGKHSFVGKEVNFCISGLRDKEKVKENCAKTYPIGTRIKFKYANVSTHGVPQSCNVYRGK